MLRGTLTHRKVRRLGTLLGIDPPEAMGLFEALCHVAAEQQRDGGIGRMRNVDIAEEMFSRRDPDALMRAFVEAELLDECDGCRLYIHDWHEHADDTTDTWLARRGIKYANGAIPRMKRISAQERATLCKKWRWANHGEHRKATKNHGEPQKTKASHKKPLPNPNPEPNPVPEPVPVTEGKESKEQAPRVWLRDDVESNDPVVAEICTSEFLSQMLDPVAVVAELQRAFPQADLLPIVQEITGWLIAGNEPQNTAEKFLRSWIGKAAPRQATARAAPRRGFKTASDQNSENIRDFLQEVKRDEAASG